MEQVASTIVQLVLPASYIAEPSRQTIFPSLNSFQWFVRRHRKRLTKMGALVRPTGRRMFIDVQRCDAAVIEIGREEAAKRAA